MTDGAFINILIAEDNEVSREMMAGIMKTQGYNVFPAIDGDSAIEVIKNHDIDLALVDINMAPKGGFEFVKYLVIKGIKTPVVIVTGDDSSDILMEANALGVRRVIQKPIEPDRLVQVVQRVLERRGINPQPFAVTARDTKYSPEELMKKAIDLADHNAKSRKGGPFGAIVADAEGRVLGEGVNGISSQADPTAHAEVMAIRQASEKLNRTDLSDCTLFCSSEPTMMGKALVISVGIKTVYYGLTHEDIREVRRAEETVRAELAKDHETQNTAYVQMGHDEALAMYKGWEQLDDKVAD